MPQVESFIFFCLCRDVISTQMLKNTAQLKIALLSSLVPPSAFLYPPTLFLSLPPYSAHPHSTWLALLLFTELLHSFLFWHLLIIFPSLFLRLSAALFQPREQTVRIAFKECFELGSDSEVERVAVADAELLLRILLGWNLLLEAGTFNRSIRRKWSLYHHNTSLNCQVIIGHFRSLMLISVFWWWCSMINGIRVQVQEQVQVQN